MGSSLNVVALSGLLSFGATFQAWLGLRESGE